MAEVKKKAPKKTVKKKVVTKKAAPQKTAVKKVVAKKKPAKVARPARKKTAAKKAASQKTVAKKVAPKKASKKTVAQKAAPKKVAAKKPAIKKKAVKKSTPVRKVAAKAQKASPVKKARPQKSGVKKAVAKKVKAVKAAVKKVAQKAMPTAAKNAQNATQQEVTFRIQRGETKQGKYESYFEEFTVKYDSSTTVLQALEDIKGDQDGSLTYRRSCRASICGSCGMFINNRSRLACRTKVIDIINGDAAAGRPPMDIIEVAPQKNQPVLRDLAVDIRPFYEKVQAIKPYIQEGDEAVTKVDKTSFEQVNMVSNCIMCGCCYSDCTEMAESGGFLGPAALAKAFRFVSDPREGNKTERLHELSKKDGIWDCTRCGMCVDACPKDVAPMEAIMKIRTRALETGVTNNRGAKHAMAFKGDILSSGMLNEPMMVLKTVGITGMLSQLPNAINLAKKGKIPSPFPHKVEGLDEIRAIYEELEENPIDVETKQEDTGPGAG